MGYSKRHIISAALALLAGLPILLLLALQLWQHGVRREMKEKLDELYDLAKQAEGAGKAAKLFGKWGWGAVGFIGAGVMTFWREIVAVLFKH